MNSELSRIHALVDDDGTSRLAEYTYLGADRTAQVDLAEPGVKCTWLRQSGDPASDDPYTGWDRFGRAVDLRWIKESSGAELERLEHGYDRASNRLYRKNRVASGSAKQDELYAYDGLYQLNDFQRGELNSGHTGMTGTLAAQEQLAFDPTGNWNSYVVDSGAPQTRTHNRANELTALNSSSALVGEDLAGNMTRVPQPGSGAAGYDLKYDAWNRLVEVKDGGTTVAIYGYDGLNRRITKTAGGNTRHFYYTDKWQIIEERLNTSSTADRQLVWGLRYIDDLILRDRGAERLYVVQDYFQPTAVLNTSGVVLERYGYKAFGTSRVMDASFVTQTTSSYEWETRFGAYCWDHETGLSQVRNRYLHPTLGRWVTRDPIGMVEGPNIYAYVANNPTNFIDQLGLAAVDDCLAQCDAKFWNDRDNCISGANSAAARASWIALTLCVLYTGGRGMRPGQRATACGVVAAGAATAAWIAFFDVCAYIAIADYAICAAGCNPPPACPNPWRPGGGGWGGGGIYAPI